MKTHPASDPARCAGGRQSTCFGAITQTPGGNRNGRFLPNGSDAWPDPDREGMTHG